MDQRLDSGRRPLRLPEVSEWPVRRKVALVVALPLLLATVLGGVRVHGALERQAEASSVASRAAVLEPAFDYLSAAEDAAVVHSEGGADESARKAAVAAVRTGAAELRQAAEGAGLTRNQRALVARALSGSETLRDGSAYASVPSSLVELGQLEADVSALVADLAASGSAAERTVALVGQLVEGRLAVTRLRLQAADDGKGSRTDDLYGQLGVESAVIGNLLRGLPDDQRVAMLRRYNASNQGAVGGNDEAVESKAPLRLYDELGTELLDDAEQTLADEAGGARTDAVVTAVAVAVALLAALVLALLVSRALVVPLRKLRDGALEVAHERLPETVAWIRSGHRPGDIEPIDVSTTEELGQLARAVDDLHRTAVRMALGEAEMRGRVADMFVTLSRRSTSLVHQQLHLIEQLERDEEDPERLESLFRLDHLASRMRRTAESLVVLADAPTQRSAQEALSVTEALHAAAAGVRDYQRITVAPAPDARIKGSAAADVVHLLTELVDNALSFSPPDSEVTVTTSSPTGMLLVEVRDHGVGIEPGTLAMLNRELRSGGQITPEATKRMGLLVVSRLARRHGVTVLLADDPEGGVNAQVFLPRPLLTGQLPAQPADDQAGDVEDDEAAAAVTGTEESLALPRRGFREPEATPDIPTEAPGWRPAAPEPWVLPELEPVTARDDLSAETLAAVINANIGLPQRQPGATEPPAAGTFFRAETEPEQVEQAGEVAYAGDLVAAVDRGDGPAAVTDEPEPELAIQAGPPAQPDRDWASLFFPDGDEEGGEPVVDTDAEPTALEVAEVGPEVPEAADPAGQDDDEAAVVAEHEDEVAPEVEDEHEDEVAPPHVEVEADEPAAVAEPAQDDVPVEQPPEELGETLEQEEQEAPREPAARNWSQLFFPDQHAVEAEAAGDESEDVEEPAAALDDADDTDATDADEPAESAEAVETVEEERPVTTWAQLLFRNKTEDPEPAPVEVEDEVEDEVEPAVEEERAPVTWARLLFPRPDHGPAVEDSSDEHAADDGPVEEADEAPAAAVEAVSEEAPTEEDVAADEPAPAPLALLPAPDLADLLGLPRLPTADETAGPEEEEFDSPIFRQLRSNWFDGDEAEQENWGSEPADAGWEAAGRAQAAPPEPEGGTGLPSRQPGDRLVPGSVSGSATPLRRDPEAIKARLSAHANGVARGRAAAAGGSTSPMTDEDEE